MAYPVTTQWKKRGSGMSAEVTAITPAYNAETYIENAILSVLEQTVLCTMIIVDDGSKDRTYEIADYYMRQYPDRVKVIQNEKNRGVASSRNRAVQMAETPYIAFLDADDWWSSKKLELQLKKLKQTGADACYSGRELMGQDGSVTGKMIRVPEQITYKKLLKGNVIPCSSVLMGRVDALKYPMVHDELHEDYIVWLSMLRDGKKFTGIDQPLLKSRLGEQGKSRNKWKSARMTYGVYRYMGIPAWKAAYYLCCYAVEGVKKYKGRGRKRS